MALHRAPPGPLSRSDLLGRFRKGPGGARCNRCALHIEGGRIQVVAPLGARWKGSQAPCPRSVEGLRNSPRTDVPFPSLLGALAYRPLTTIRAQQRAGGALSGSAK